MNLASDRLLRPCYKDLLLLLRRRCPTSREASLPLLRLQNARLPTRHLPRMLLATLRPGRRRPTRCPPGVELRAKSLPGSQELCEVRRCGHQPSQPRPATTRRRDVLTRSLGGPFIASPELAEGCDEWGAECSKCASQRLCASIVTRHLAITSAQADENCSRPRAQAQSDGVALGQAR